MTTPCSKCRASSVTYIRYSGTHLCAKHFVEYVERRVKKDIKKQGKTSELQRVGIALSGGKDSTVTLHLLADLFQQRRGVELFAITVDEGIRGYRDESIPIAQKNCKKLGIEHHIISFRDTVQCTMDDIASKHDALGECSYCGVFRRFCLNKKAKELTSQGSPTTARDHCPRSSCSSRNPSTA